MLQWTVLFLKTYRVCWSSLISAGRRKECRLYGIGAPAVSRVWAEEERRCRKRKHKTFLSELAYNHWMDWGHTPKFLLFLYPLDRLAKIEAVLHFSDTASSWVAKEKLNWLVMKLDQYSLLISLQSLQQWSFCVMDQLWICTVISISIKSSNLNIYRMYVKRKLFLITIYS